MDPKTLSNWSIAAGFLGIILYIVAFVLLWQHKMIGGKLDDKDLYYAGSGLLYVAIWFKLGAIYHKGGSNM